VDITRPDAAPLIGRPFTIARLPRIRFGAGTASELASVVARHGDRSFLVTGERSFSGERLQQLRNDLATLGVDLVGHVRTGAEPGPAGIDAYAAEARHRDADVILGIGGGSVLDTAKAVAGLARSGTSVMDHVEGVGRGVPYVGPAIPFVAVPTTAGTGSEVTRNAVVTLRGEHGFKRSFRDDRLIATDVVVDPDLMAGASPTLIAANGLDALTQLLEAYTSTGASAMTDALALEGMAAVRDGLLPWHADPMGPDASAARAGMAWAALLSGICLANAGLGAVHGLAAPIGSLLPIAHGAACGAILAPTVRANIAALQARDPGAPGLPRYATAGRLLAGLDRSTTDTEARTALVDLLAGWTATLDVAGLRQLGLGQRHVAGVLAGVSTGSMRSNPVPLTDDELRAILLG
jgi:alcohol dehydrogenase class IV